MGRKAHRSITIGGNSRCIAPAYGAPQVIGADQRRRKACFDDYLRIAKLMQASDLLHISGGLLGSPQTLTPTCPIHQPRHSNRGHVSGEPIRRLRSDAVILEGSSAVEKRDYFSRHLDYTVHRDD